MERNFMSYSHGIIEGGFIFVPENVTLHTYARFGHSIYQVPEDIHIKNMLNKEPFNYPGVSRVNFSDRKDGSNKFTDAGYKDEEEWMDINGVRNEINQQNVRSYEKFGISFLSREEEEEGRGESLSKYYTWVKKEMRTYESGQIVPEHELDYSKGFWDQMKRGLIDIDKLKDILEAENQRESFFREKGITFEDYIEQLDRMAGKWKKSTEEKFQVCDPYFQNVLSAISSYLIDYYGQPIYEEYFKTKGDDFGLDLLIMAELAGEGVDIISKSQREREGAIKMGGLDIGHTLFDTNRVGEIESKPTDGLLGGYLLDTPAKAHSVISEQMKLSELFEKAQELSKNTPGVKINIYLHCCRALDLGTTDNGFDAYETKLKKCTEIDPNIFQGTFLQEILNPEQDLYSLTREISFSGLEIRKDQIMGKLDLYKERILKPLGISEPRDIETLKIKIFPNHPDVLKAIKDTILRNANKEIMIQFFKNFHSGVIGDKYIFNGIEGDDTLSESHIINKLLNSGNEGNITKALDLIRLYFINHYRINELAFNVFYITLFIIYILPELRQMISEIGEFFTPPPPNYFVRFDFDDFEQDNTNLTRYGCFGNFNINTLCNLLYFNKSMTEGNIESFCEYVDYRLYETKCAEEEKKFDDASAPQPAPQSTDWGRGVIDGGEGIAIGGGRRRKKKRKTKRKKSKKNPKRKSKRKSKRRRR